MYFGAVQLKKKRKGVRTQSACHLCEASIRGATAGPTVGPARSGRSGPEWESRAALKAWWRASQAESHRERWPTAVDLADAVARELRSRRAGALALTLAILVSRYRRYANLAANVSAGMGC